ncbi:hypothetical protein AB1Y20_005896 [Prymnesium parvum]|uniref:N-acetyltransferase domain-containing protein n=1 Tax=Prymnesium parvum TaxID=97485 RepID=A0AB34J334_PRYPA
MADRLLIFRAPARGQGMGNMLQGLATAMLLSEQYGRTLCVWWKLFEHGYARRDGSACPSKAEVYAPLPSSQTALLAADAWLELWDSGPTTPEREWRRVLASSARAVVVVGNLLLAPSHRRAAAFESAFTPTEALAALLQRERARRRVAHLRVGDVGESARRGIFAEAGAWRSLRAHLPRDTYVVSDSEECYRELRGFASPAWGAQPHSASVQSIAASSTSIIRSWAEWNVLRQSTILFHTPSAFSETAWLFSSSIESRCVLHNTSALRACTKQLDTSDTWDYSSSERYEL